MDPALEEAATNGDIEFLKEAVSKQPSEYFGIQPDYDDYIWEDSNIFLVAIWNRQLEFFREATRILPMHIQEELAFHKDKSGWTMLHLAADRYNLSHLFVKLIREMYESFDKDHLKPWLALTQHNETPLHLALKKQKEKCAVEILLMDPEFESCTIVDDKGNTPLYYALIQGCSLVAEMILMSPISPTSAYRSKINTTPFVYASNCSENVVRLLFRNYGDLIIQNNGTGFSILHQWADDGKAGPCKLLLEFDDFADVRSKVFKEMIFRQEKKNSDTPLHIAATKKDSEIGQILIRGYQQKLSVDDGENQEIVAVQVPPWKIKNIHGDTPLHCALNSKHEDLALQILSVDPSVCQIRNNKGESPFFLSVQTGCERVIVEIMRIEEPRYQMLRRDDGMTVVHNLWHCSEETGRKVLEKYWWIINMRDEQGKTALEYTKQTNALWLENLLTNPYLIEKEPFDWIEACKRGETSALLSFVDNCQDLQRVCREQDDTPLHHIKLPTYEEYLRFLKIPSIAELKNITDHDGATALHRALERKDMLLAKALLLDAEVDQTTPDDNGTTAMDLLAKLCTENDDWEKMCKQIKVNPYLKTSYIDPGANLEEIRNTLSVVAALLATITFAAGFTLPGGINSDTGQALLAKTAGFLVFLLADVYAMCTSMLVLFCLIWSMVSEPDMARLLVDRSVFILMQSLYGTLLAFVTGIYVVIAHNTLWVAIVIFVMCSIIGISANRTILHKVIAKFVPTAGNRDKQYRRMRMHEEEMEIIIVNEEPRPIE